MRRWIATGLLFLGVFFGLLFMLTTLANWILSTLEVAK
jgi:hypothetical protein